jgi:hypothetical protein
VELLEERQEPQQQEPHERQERQERHKRRADRYLLRLPRRKLAALLAGSVLLGTVAGYALGARGRSGAAPTGAAVRAHATPECTSAVARANESLSYAVGMGRAFVEQAQVVEQLGRQQITREDAVRSGRAAAAKGGAAAAKFDEALAGYLRVVDSCQLEGP